MVFDNTDDDGDDGDDDDDDDSNDDGTINKLRRQSEISLGGWQLGTSMIFNLSRACEPELWCYRSTGSKVNRRRNPMCAIHS